MAQIVDMQGLERQIAQFVLVLEGRAELPEPEGSLARGQMAITTAVTRWRAEETNRGTTPNEVANVMVRVFAASFQSQVTTIVQDRQEQLNVINRMLRAFGEEIASIRVGGRETTTYRAEFKDE